MDMRNEILFPQCWRASEFRANAAPQWIMANCGTRVNLKSRMRHRSGAIRARSLQARCNLNGEIFLGELEAVEVSYYGSGHAAGLEKFAGELLDVFDGHAFEQRD